MVVGSYAVYEADVMDGLEAFLGSSLMLSAVRGRTSSLNLEVRVCFISLLGASCKSLLLG